MASTSPVSSFPACPKCHEGQGVPHRVATVPDNSVDVSYQCSKCGHNWQVRVPNSLPFQKL